MLRLREYCYGAKVGWHTAIHDEPQWNEICAWSLETFGLPGDAFVTEPTEDFMIWWFRSDQDRMIFLLRNGRARRIDLDPDQK